MSNIILPQRIWAGRYNAQVAFKNKSVSDDRKVKQFEIELPMEDGGVSYIDGQSHPITTNLVICAKPGQTRHTRLPFKCYYIHVTLTEGLLYDTLMSLPNFIETVNTDRIRKIFERICECHVSERAENELLQKGLLLELAYALCLPNTLSKAKGGNKAVEKALRFIENNLTSELNLERVATEVKFAPSYFHKLFKASTGKPLHQYIEDLRIEKAIELLITTEMTLTQIAYECGFSSQSYFSYAFKRHTGMTPRAYARKAVERYEKSLSATHTKEN